MSKNDIDARLLITRKREEASAISQEINKIETLVLEKQKEIQELRYLHSQMLSECETAERELAAKDIQLEQWYQMNRVESGYAIYCYPIGVAHDYWFEGVMINIGSGYCFAFWETAIDPRRVIKDTRLKALVQYGDLSSVRDFVLTEKSCVLTEKSCSMFVKKDGKWIIGE